jgi:paraquat-inducible protein B
MTEAQAKVAKRRRISAVWLIPLVALVLGIWLVVYTWLDQGPEIEIAFQTADGIEAGKTKIKARSVEVGVVESVVLGDDFESVIVTSQLERTALPLLREDTKFWVVRARVGTAGISGLGTLLSGGYIELEPGSGAEGRRSFIGLENPPVTPAGTAGLRFALTSDQALSVGTGTPILYRGYRVGRVESGEFEMEERQMHYRAFIEAPYDDLVTTSSRFWNVSGISFSATADGIELSTGSLEALVRGGITFGVPPGIEPGSAAQDDAVFHLYGCQKEIGEVPNRHRLEYVVEFARSVRGLKPGAPVEYRGLRIGRVDRVLIDELMEYGGGEEASPIPVLIHVAPGLLRLEDSKAGVADLRQRVEEGVLKGMRATLATGNLLTGSLFVALEVYPGAEPAEVGSFAGHPTIPTISSGLQGLEQKISTLLDKLNGLPLDDVAQSLRGTLRSVRGTLQEADGAIDSLAGTIAQLNAIIASDDMQSLPQSIRNSLRELDRTLQSVNALAATLEDQPNTLIFPRRREPDPEPAAGAP